MFSHAYQCFSDWKGKPFYKPKKLSPWFTETILVSYINLDGKKVIDSERNMQIVIFFLSHLPKSPWGQSKQTKAESFFISALS